MRHYTAVLVQALEEGEKPVVGDNLEYALSHAYAEGQWTGNTDNEIIRKGVEVVTAEVPLETTAFVPGTCLVNDKLPDHLAEGVWADLSGSAPFSWGDNNRTLITLERFRDHAAEVLYDAEDQEVLDWLEWLKELDGNLYVDLEN